MRLGDERDIRRLINQRIDENARIKAVSAAHTVSDGERYIFGDATGASFTVTLPSAIGRRGREYDVKRLNGGANVVIIASASNIDGAAAVTLSAQYQSFRLVSDGTTWNIV